MACERSTRALGAVFSEADEIEISERRHGATLNQLHIGSARRPARVTCEGEFRTPAKLARRRLEPMFERAPQSRFGTNAADQHDLASRLEHARELVERR